MQILEGARLLVNEIKAKAGFNSIPVKGATLTYDSDRPLNDLDLVHKQWVEDNFSSSGGFPDSLEEDTYIGNPDNFSFKLGEDGDSINLNVEVPNEFQPFANTFSGFDYQSDNFKAIVGLVKGIDFPEVDFNNTDVVGTFMIEGDPFNPATGSEGSVYMDGVWYNEDDDEVTASRAVITLKEGNIDSINLFRQYRGEQSLLLQGENVEQTIFLGGDNSEQILAYIGDNGLQQTSYLGNFGTQASTMRGNNNENETYILGNNNKITSLMEGGSNTHETIMLGSDNIITRKVINDTNNKSFEEYIEENNHITTLDGDYNYTAENYNVTANALRFVTGTNHFVIGSSSSSVRSSASAVVHNFQRNGGFYLGSVGAYRAIDYIASTRQMGFFNATPVSQQVVPLGSTSDEIIQALQNLGLFTEI